ncbi:helix-turn-helix domain-containing protein [Clostridium estertheticum]|uniref:Helix-turn-helix transcriptional regulator n=1 Tax=Clostridium estertheticum TaxID=238834 RepID=A0A7Y3SZC2_9CLOT|nr:helix-turn-helix transcriptional regulator [Clostridium estertheticum]NNU78159.1 helix-turn-helix transcriptional regulator [Clostridium estertheticum]WBL47729.1 helix-turn-helix domain-containing protein [Clostridium estertheticum]
MEDITSFGEIIKRERESKGLSLKGLADLISKVEENAITSSYLSRLENNDKNNPTFRLTCLITKMMGLDFKEVVHSFGYDELLDTSSKLSKFQSLDTLIRLNKINAPSIMDSGEVFDEVPLTEAEKEIFINLMKLIFTFTLETDSDNIIHLLKGILVELEVIRKSRQKTISL